MMDYRLDEKGKYYTTRVTKRSVSVVAFAQGTVISGTMHLLLDNRVKDELNGGEHFVALTHAQVRDLASGQILCEDETVLLNKEHVVWIVPHDEPREPANANPEETPEPDGDSHTHS